MFSNINNSQETWNQENHDPNLNIEEESEKIFKGDYEPVHREEFKEDSEENSLGDKSVSSKSEEQDASDLRNSFEELSSTQFGKKDSYENPDRLLISDVYEIIKQKSYNGKDREAWEDLCSIESTIKEQFPKLSPQDKFDLSIIIAAIYCLGHRNSDAEEMLNQAEKHCSNFLPKNHCELFARMWNLRGDIEGRKGNLDQVLAPLTNAKNLFSYFRRDEKGKKAKHDAKAWNHSNKGQYWLKMKKFKRAEKHYQKALKLRKDLKNGRLVSLAYCNLTNLYTECEKLDRAERYAKKCMKSIEDFNKDFYLKGKLLCIQAKICHKRNKHQEAVELHNQGLEILKTRLAPDNDLSLEYGKITYQSTSF